MKHVHAEVIHAFADGALVQVRIPGSEHWANTIYPDFDKKLEYRIKPEPAAPKWPQTTMSYSDLAAAATTAEKPQWDSDQAKTIANAALAHACESGALVPADKVREIEAKARAEGAKSTPDAEKIIQAAFEYLRVGDAFPVHIQNILARAAK